jgi:hypothetical protein
MMGSPTSANAEQATDLPGARHKFLRLLLQRATTLRWSSPPPQSYYLGQEYAEDPVRVDSVIAVRFIYPGLINPTEFWHRNNRLVLRQRAALLTVEIHRKLSGRLWDELRLFGWGQRFIIGYVEAMMPAVNRKLLDNRYLIGEPLSRTYSLLEATGIAVMCLGAWVPITWPVSLLPFPRSAELAPGRDEIYLRDFVDANHSYLRNDFEDCIRRLVTSVETFFAHRRWTANPKPNTFKAILDSNVSQVGLAGRVVVKNLKFIYKVRNKIVHGGFRMGSASGRFCSKAVASVRYLIQGYSGVPKVSRYAHSLGMQLLRAEDVLGHMHNLDQIERHASSTLAAGPVINSAAELDEFMFRSLEFTEKDRSSIL